MDYSCILLYMNRIVKKIFKWIGLAFTIVVLPALAAVVILTTPGPFFPESKQYDAITVHSEEPIGHEIDSIIARVRP